MDLYSPVSLCYLSECLASAAYGGLSDGPHTLEIEVTGTAHPNAIGYRVKLDYIDTWDGTLYTDGIFEQDDTRVWATSSWNQILQPEASGGSYMNDGGVSNNGSVWFPFTGDSASFIALATYNSQSVSVWVDGVWEGNVLIYSGSPISRSYSFSGFGPGPHVMLVSSHRGEPNIDAFVTPANGPDYETPDYTGIVRYEEDHPALLYNGYDLQHRPTTWSTGNAGQASIYSYMQSATISDTVSLTFDGSWLNIGLRTRNRGGLAEVAVDGVSYGVVNAYTPYEDVVSYQYDLLPGTHTVTLTILGESDPPSSYHTVYLDYIEIWDTTPVTDTFQNTRRSAESARVHVSSSVSDGSHENAIQGDYVSSGLPNSLANVWYSFVGDSFTFLGLTVSNGGSAEIYVDGILTDTVSFDYPFSVQPFAFHYTGFDYGPHVVRVHNVSKMRIDGFIANPPDLNPYQPIAEWWDNSPAGSGAPLFGTVGIASGMTAGDINNDGDVEIVVTADDMINYGSLFVYRGDGADTGSGTPILWSHDFGGGAFRTWVGSPAIADLDGQPGSEIVVAAGSELWAFYSDGTTYWMTDTASIFETLSAPAIGNLDLDPEPEIVINLGKTLEIREHDGTLAWSKVYAEYVNPPLLADLTGDGLLDLVITGWNNQVEVYDFNLGSPQLVWTATLTTSLGGTFGAPAIADIDGQQPGGDALPEIAVASYGALTVLNGEDGSVVWEMPLDPGNPGGVSIADLDGDGEVEIVTGMKYDDGTGQGRLYALNADGSILWWTPAYDSSSANNASTLDLDGDGIYEVAWNGKEQGFTLFSGLDGSVLFNEPLLNSVTGTDYPLIVDVDNDGHAEVVVAALKGLRIIGYGEAWSDARPLWNQHSYHITNVNDDLSVPYSEFNSWDAHNTYRTQTTLRTPLPVYAVTLTHTVGIDGVTVLTDTFNVDPDVPNNPEYTWNYTQSWSDPVVTRTFDVQLPDMRPGESRLAAEGSYVTYSLPSGQNRIQLPPLYVSAPHIVQISPAALTVAAGGTIAFDVILLNPDRNKPDTYLLSLSGIPDVWADYQAAIPMGAGETVTTTLNLTIPADTPPDTLPVILDVRNSLGATDQAAAWLTVVEGLDVTITPDMQTTAPGEIVTYTLTIKNFEGEQRSYALSALGLTTVNLPGQVTVEAGSTVVIQFTVSSTASGPQPFTIVASATGGAAASSDAILETTGGAPVASLSLAPNPAVTGPGSTVEMTVTVSNIGYLPGTFDLSVEVPTGWSYTLQANGYEISSVALPPHLFNTSNINLLVTPGVGTAPGDYPVTITTVTQGNPDAVVRSTGTVQVINRGVQVEIISGPLTLDPRLSGVLECEGYQYW